MFKYFLFSISIFSFLISNQVNHSYDGVIASFTKTSDPGRVNFGVSSNNAEYENIYINDRGYSFADLSALSEIAPDLTYSGYHINTIFETAGFAGLIPDEFDLTDFHFSYNTIKIDASYHGYNGMGYYVSHEVGEMAFPYLTSIQQSWKPSTTSTTIGVYALWNEIYSTSSPAIVDGEQYTFPTTRIFTGFYLNRYRDLFDVYSDVAYIRLAMDFIISNKLISSHKLDYELSDDSDVFMSLFTSKFIYDLNSNVSIAASSLFEQDNQGNYLSSLLLEGGYQFNNFTYGYTKLDFKLIPYFRVNIGGKNEIYSNEEFGIKIDIFFN